MSEFHLPAEFVGGDLFWWRTGAGMRTIVSCYWYDYLCRDEVSLVIALFDVAGKLRAHTTRPVSAGDFVVVDSSNPPFPMSHPLDEGLLAVFVTTNGQPSQEFRRRYRRLYAMVDWISDEGDLVSLHSDQTFGREPEPVELGFTEMLILESQIPTTEIVFLNGPHPQRPSSLSLEISNERGERCSFDYQIEMAPFTVHRLQPSAWLNHSEVLVTGGDVQVRGNFRGTGVFMRPYVVINGSRLSGYHGGNRYPEMSPMPALLYQFLGRGEVNPMVAIHEAGVTTDVTIFNSHGAIEGDFPIDARLYDREGRLASARDGWLIARRDGFSRGTLMDLLSPGCDSFVGHIALSFGSNGSALYPPVVQALLSYRTPKCVASVMAWSDQWNSDERRFRAARDSTLYHSYFRVWISPMITTYLSLSNCGVTMAYGHTARYTMRLFTRSGEISRSGGVIPPHATIFGTVGDLFPGSMNIGEGEETIGLVVVESPDDLAIMHLDRHERSGAYAAEHFMSVPIFRGEKVVLPAGA